MMALAFSYSRRSDVSLIASELNRLVGGHYFCEVRSYACDSDGYWKYYISQVRDCPLKQPFSVLLDEAVLNLRSRGLLHA